MGNPGPEDATWYISAVEVLVVHMQWFDNARGRTRTRRHGNSMECHTPKAFHVTPSMRHIQITCWVRRLWQGAVALRHGRSVSIARRQHSILSAWRRPALVSSMYQVKSKRKRAVRGTEPEVRIPQDVSDEASTAPPRALSTVDSLFTVPSLLYRIL